MSERGDLFDRAFGHARMVRVFEDDRELLSEVPYEDRAEACSRAIAPLLVLGGGRWDAPASAVEDYPTCLGLLVLDGLLLHSVTVGREPRSELVGTGDVIRPWEQEDDAASVPFASCWEAIHPARLAVLESRFAALLPRWPRLLPALIGRATRRSRWLALQLALGEQRRVDDRLMLFFWHMADRWGRVRPDGVLVPLPVTHDVLAQLIGVQRPTVTSALGRLSDRGLVHRQADKSWLLPRRPPAASVHRALTGGSMAEPVAGRMT
jgi:CRP-like cAMP-binding protein